MAERDGASLNQFLVAAVAERVGAETLYEQVLQQLGELDTTLPTLRLHVHGLYTPACAGDFNVKRQESPVTTSDPHYVLLELAGRG
jgi:hypothetical protein